VFKRKLFYDCEIVNCIPDPYRNNQPDLSYCDGWHDFEGMGISVIGTYWKGKYRAFFFHQLQEFQEIVNQADEVIGFNSISFDDRLMAANGVDITTTYDLLYEVRKASDQPGRYVRGLTRRGYSLQNLAVANLGVGKTGSGEFAPKLWQRGERQKVVDYCLNDVRLLVKLYGLFKAGKMYDPTNGYPLPYKVFSGETVAANNPIAHLICFANGGRRLNPRNWKRNHYLLPWKEAEHCKWLMDAYKPAATEEYDDIPF
jgi:hypothetical protein